MKIQISYHSGDSVELDFETRLRKMDYKYFAKVDELKAMLEKSGDRKWIPRLDNFERWLKNYKGVIDLGYIVLLNEKGEIERIINIHLHYSVWLQRPAIRISEIAEFVSEWFEDED
jgi:hypothetical protein